MEGVADADGVGATSVAGSHRSGIEVTTERLPPVVAADELGPTGRSAAMSATTTVPVSARARPRGLGSCPLMRGP